MPSLRDCLGRAGKLISPADAEAMHSRSALYQKDGHAVDAAERMAVEHFQQEARGHLESIYEQVGIKQPVGGGPPQGPATVETAQSAASGQRDEAVRPSGSEAGGPIRAETTAGEVAPEITSPPTPPQPTEITPSPSESAGAGGDTLPARVRVAGAEYDVVSRNPDGTLKVRSESGEFDLSPGEAFTPLARAAPVESRNIDFSRTTREQFVADELGAKERIRKLAALQAEQAIRKNWTPRKPLPVGIDKVQAFLAQERLSPADRKLRTAYEIAKRNVDADTRSDADIAGRVYDTLKERGAPVNIGPRDTTISTGTGTPTPHEEGIISDLRKQGEERATAQQAEETAQASREAKLRERVEAKRKLSVKQPAEATPSKPAAGEQATPAVPGNADPRRMDDADIKTEADAMAAAAKPFYDQLEAMGDTAFGDRTKYTPEAQKLDDAIRPYARRKEILDMEAARRDMEARNKAGQAKREAEIAAAPVWQRRNGWEIVRRGTEYVLRDPHTKEDIYANWKLARVREVADESAPDVPPGTTAPKEPAPPPPAPEGQKPPAHLKPAERIAELEAGGVTQINGKPLSEANAAEIINAVGKLRRGEEPAAKQDIGALRIKPDSVTALSRHGTTYDDSPTLSIKPGSKLADVIDAPELFKRYPALADIKLSTVRDWDGMSSYRTGRIRIVSDTTGEQQVKYLIHELQHAIQEQQGKQAGADYRSAGYRQHPSEIEAREVAKAAKGIWEEAAKEFAGRAKPADIIDRLRSKRIDPTTTVGSGLTGTYIAAHNAALQIAELAIRAGRKIAEVVKLAAQRFKALHPGATAEEVGAITEIVEHAQKSPQQQSGPAATNPPSGMTFTGPVEPAGEQFRRRSKSALGEYEYVSTTNAGREKYAQEFADFHEKNGSYESAVSEMRAIDNPGFRGVVAGELLARKLEANAKQTGAEKLVSDRQIQSLWGDVMSGKTEPAQALQANALINERLGPFTHILAWQDLVRSRFETATEGKIPKDTVAQVQNGVKTAGDEAAEALRNSLEAPEGTKPTGKNEKAVTDWLAAHTTTLALLRKAATARGIKWADVFNDLPENQEARKAELFERVKDHPKLQNLNESQQKLLAEKLSDAWTYLRNQIFRNEFSRLVPLPKVLPADAAKVKSVIGELIKYSNLGLLDNTAFLNALAGKYGLENMDGPTAKKLTDLATKIQRAENEAEKARLSLEMLNTFHVAKGVKPTAIATSMAYAGILSGYTSFTGGNLGGNILQTISQLGTTAITNPKRIGTLAKGYAAGIPEGFRQALSIIATGHGGQDAASILAESRGDALELLATRDIYPKLTKAMPGVAKVLKKYPGELRHVSRWYRAVDSLAYYPAKEAYTRVAAEKLLEANYSGEELARQVQKHLSIGKGDFESAVKQAEKEGFTGRHEQARRVSDIIEERRRGTAVGTQAAEAGKRFGESTTLNMEPEGVAGIIYRLAVQGKAQLPVSTPFLMFLRVPTNFTNNTLNYTPIGALRASGIVGAAKAGVVGAARGGLAEGISAAKAELAQGGTSITGLKREGGEWKAVKRRLSGDEQSRLYIQSAIGSALMGYFAQAALGSKPDDDDTFDLTATGPRGASANAQWKAAGNIPYSLRIPGTRTRINYQNSPLAVPLALAGHVADAARYEDEDYRTTWSALSKAVQRFPSVIFGFPMVQGLNELAKMTDPNRPDANGAARFFQNMGQSIVVPRLLTQIAQTFDDRVKYGGVLEYDSLGEPVRRQPSKRFVSTETTNPLRAWLDKAEIVVPVPGDVTKVHKQKVKLTPEQHSELQRQAGTMTRIILERRLPGLQVMKRDAAEAEVKRIAQEQIERVRDRMKSQQVIALPARP